MCINHGGIRERKNLLYRLSIRNLTHKINVCDNMKTKQVILQQNLVGEAVFDDKGGNIYH